MWSLTDNSDNIYRTQLHFFWNVDNRHNTIYFLENVSVFRGMRFQNVLKGVGKGLTFEIQAVDGTAYYSPLNTFFEYYEEVKYIFMFFNEDTAFIVNYPILFNPNWGIFMYTL